MSISPEDFSALVDDTAAAFPGFGGSRRRDGANPLAHWQEGEPPTFAAMVPVADVCAFVESWLDGINSERDAALAILAPPLVNCIRGTENLDNNTLYSLLAQAGVTTLEPYDPGNPEHDSSLRQEIGGADPGDEIWLLTPLGKRLLGEEAADAGE